MTYIFIFLNASKIKSLSSILQVLLKQCLSNQTYNSIIHSPFKRSSQFSSLRKMSLEDLVGPAEALATTSPSTASNRSSILKNRFSTKHINDIKEREEEVREEWINIKSGRKRWKWNEAKEWCEEKTQEEDGRRMDISRRCTVGRHAHALSPSPQFVLQFGKRKRWLPVSS